VDLVRCRRLQDLLKHHLFSINTSCHRLHTFDLHFFEISLFQLHDHFFSTKKGSSDVSFKGMRLGWYL